MCQPDTQCSRIAGGGSVPPKIMSSDRHECKTKREHAHIKPIANENASQVLAKRNCIDHANCRKRSHSNYLNGAQDPLNLKGVCLNPPSRIVSGDHQSFRERQDEVSANAFRVILAVPGNRRKPIR